MKKLTFDPFPVFDSGKPDQAIGAIKLQLERAAARFPDLTVGERKFARFAAEAALVERFEMMQADIANESLRRALKAKRYRVDRGENGQRTLRGLSRINVDLLIAQRRHFSCLLVDLPPAIFDLREKVARSTFARYVKPENGDRHVWRELMQEVDPLIRLARDYQQSMHFPPKNKELDDAAAWITSVMGAIRDLEDRWTQHWTKRNLTASSTGSLA